LSEGFFFEKGLPSFETKFPTLLPELAAGLTGPGSECFGVDDDLSRDHDWGPRFCVWLPERSFAAAGPDIREWYEALPKAFRGQVERMALPGEEYRSGVAEISAFYGRHSGLRRKPATIEDWIQLSEEGCAACTNGAIFIDNLGEFSEWRAALAAYYPEDLRLKKIAAHVFLAGQSAQYNYPRALARKHLFTLHYLETIFCNELLALAFALNRRFAPYFKWRHILVAGLPRYGATASRIVDDVLAADGGEEKMDRMASACGEITAMLNGEGLAGTGNESLIDRAIAINEGIGDRMVRDEIPFVQ
jgi:hypothetical protein